MKKFFDASHYLQLCIATAICSNPIVGKQVTKQTNKPITPKIQSISTPKISINQTNNDPEILDINKSVKIVNSESGCNADKWNNNQEASCQCCLTYGKGRFGKEYSADQIIEYCCKHSKQCDENSFNNIKQKYNAQNMSSDNFLKTLYNNTAVVHKMTFNQLLLGPEGSLTEDLLATILVKAYNEGKLTDPDFSKKEYLTIKKTSVSGQRTLQFFFVTSTRNPSKQVVYVVKESKNGLAESINLRKIEDYPGMQQMLAPKIVKDFPTIALPFFYFSYHPHDENIHYITTMPGADGVVLYDLLKEFRDNQTTENEKKVKKAYEILGIESSNFHKKFMKPIPGKKLGKTVAHGDFHPHNIFFDEKLEHCTFIDNETMTRCFGNLQVPTVDFKRLIFTPFTTDDNPLQLKQLLNGVNPETHLNMTLKPFIKGYISVYQPHERKQLLRDLREIFTTTTTLRPWTVNTEYIQKIIKENINPIFDEIEKTLQ